MDDVQVAISLIEISNRPVGSLMVNPPKHATRVVFDTRVTFN
ncbi:hypothetical protein [Ensifer sp. MJa1]